MNKLLSITLCLSGLIAAGCGAEIGGATDPAPQNPNSGEIAAASAQSGVVYIAHAYEDFLMPSHRLLWFRVDSDTPRLEGELDVGSPTQSMALDPENNLLAVVSAEARSTTLYTLTRPSGPSEASVPPARSGVLNVETGTPLFAEFNSQTETLYVSVSPDASGVVTENLLYAYDVSSPSTPKLLDGAPYTIPVTASWTIDSARKLLWLVDFDSDSLHGYDLLSTGIREIPGGAIPLRSLYPLDNQNTFRARDLSVDPMRNRIYAARSQGNLSELIAIQYDAYVPTGDATYGESVSMSSLSKVEDGFDLASTSSDRATMMDAYEVAIDTQKGAVVMSGAIGSGFERSAVISAFQPDVSVLGVGCNAADNGFGCFLENYFEFEPVSKRQSDGALCVDSTHKVIASTSIAMPEEEPGFTHFFKYDDNLTMDVMLGEDGKNIRASSFPISAICF